MSGSRPTDCRLHWGLVGFDIAAVVHRYLCSRRTSPSPCISVVCSLGWANKTHLWWLGCCAFFTPVCFVLSLFTSFHLPPRLFHHSHPHPPLPALTYCTRCTHHTYHCCGPPYRPSLPLRNAYFLTQADCTFCSEARSSQPAHQAIAGHTNRHSSTPFCLLLLANVTSPQLYSQNEQRSGMHILSFLSPTHRFSAFAFTHNKEASCSSVNKRLTHLADLFLHCCIGYRACI